MDADCLIKITCAGLKEPTLACFETTCPGAVRDEVVRDGAGRSESQLVQANLEAGRLAVFEGTLEQGDDALVEAFNSGGFDVVATDDRRLIRRLDPLGIPCVVPGLLLHELAVRGKLSDPEVVAGLERLRPLIGAEEYQMTRFLLQGAREEPRHGGKEHTAD